MTGQNIPQELLTSMYKSKFLNLKFEIEGEGSTSLEIWNWEGCFAVSRGKTKQNKNLPIFSVIVICNTYIVPATRVLT